MLLKLIKDYLSPYRRTLTGVVVLQILATMTTLYLPNLNAQIIDNGVAKGDTGYIWQRGGLMLAVSLVQIGCQIWAVYLGSKAAMQFGRDVRGAVFGHVLDFSSREVNAIGAASLITRNTNDVQQVQMLVMMTSNLIVGAPIMMAGGVYMALRQDVGLSWLILVCVALLGVFIMFVISRMHPLFGINQTRLDTLNRVLREQISGIRVIRAFVREPTERERFAQANADLRDVGIRIGTLFAMLFPAVNLIMNVGSVGVMWFGGLRVDGGHMQVGQLIAFLTYLMQILMSVMMATMMGMMAPRAAVSAERILGVLNTPSTVTPAAHPVTDVTEAGHVRFEDVEFSYPGAESPVLSGINLELTPGTTTAIIGSTGSGKTTLVNLIPRLYDPTGGRIMVDGVDSRDLDMDLLWSRIGLVPQAPYLFSGTIRSNLRYGNPDATDDQMWEALAAAQAADVVKAIDGQLDAQISQGGTNVSGGQRQRLSIARALIKKPDIYVFDDAFSALDVTTDARLRSALHKVTGQAAVLMVAQRVSSIREADQIIVLDSGGIVGRGTHQELLATCPTYQEIVDSQLTAEEAA